MSLNKETAKRWFQHSHMNELLKQFEGTTTVMASEMQAEVCLEAKKKYFFIY